MLNTVNYQDLGIDNTDHAVRRDENGGFTNPALTFIEQRFGMLELHETIDGVKIIILPTNSISAPDLDPNNWGKSIHLGNFRTVRHFYETRDGSKLNFVVKEPERVLTTSLRELNQGVIWWGGRRSGESARGFPNEPLVEEQAVWEAAILLELDRNGVRVEKPQALIQHSNGQYDLVVEYIAKHPDRFIRPIGLSHDEIIDYIKSHLGIEPWGDHAFNNIVNVEGENTIIDVNRWSWRPHTDGSRNILIEMLKTR